MIVMIMGVSGAGKTTIGKLLAQELGWAFYDADDFHSQANKDKMSRGVPLNDEDRAGWLEGLRALEIQSLEARRSIVLACSALKREYRDLLRVSDEIHLVYLRGNYDQIEARMKTRKGHYMKPDMLASQFAILEEPSDALVVDSTKKPGEIVAIIRKTLVGEIK
ncbi:MAG TPA: gluconokinase [Anaerolineales bacterium]|nr:gluconokinase [Anaerolineales bacterium]